jgi:peptide-methionine (S)-S-oxide reductase
MAETETATLAGGCFWCLEAVYQELEGVISVTSGYMGGNVVRPSYEQVCTGRTGHAEAVQVTYDPARLSYEELLEVFFGIHDPTTKDRQGNDIGPQYRSAIFFHSEAQRRAASAIVQRLEREQIFSSKIVTEVAPAGEFYPAEDYHQNYFRTHAEQPYCVYVVSPKVAKFRKRFAGRLMRTQPARNPTTPQNS